MVNNKKYPDFEVVVIGAGIAGLCTSYFLTKKKIDHVVIERGEIANTWKHERWDNFYLVNPNWAMKIPEFGFDSDHFPSDNPDGFLNKSEVVNYIKAFGNFIGSKIYENESEHAYSPGSVTVLTDFYPNSGGFARVSCNNWSKEAKKKYNWVDNLKVSLGSNEFLLYLRKGSL